MPVWSRRLDVSRTEHQAPSAGAAPYAPLPTSARRTNVRVGSAMQRRPRTVQFLSVVALLAGFAYLAWRIAATAQGVHPLLFWPLWIAEAWGFVAVAGLVLDAWRIDPTPRPRSLDLPVDIVIATYNEDADIVEPTILGALAVRGSVTVHLCDDGRRPEMAALAALHGVRYVTRPDNVGAKAGNINAVLPSLAGELLLILDADHVPAPDILEAVTGYFSDPQVAVVQTAHSFRNHNSVMHEHEGRHEQSLFFDVLLPGRNRLETVIWAGSAAVLRISALRAVGGLSTRTSTEDFETSLILQLAGYRIVYHNEHLIQGLAPDNLAAYVTQRARWAEGTLASYQRGHRLAIGRHLRLRQRLSYVGGLLYYLTPIQRLIFTIYVVLVGLLGILPVGPQENLWTFLVFWGVWTAASMLAVTALERGTTRPLEGTRNLFVAMEAFLRAIPWLWVDRQAVFKVTPKNEVDLGGFDAIRHLRLPLALTAITLAVLGVRWSDTLLTTLGRPSFLPAVPQFALAIITVFGLVEAFLVLRFTRRMWVRRQYRQLWRFPVSLPARLDGGAARCIDLHQRGAAFVIDEHVISDTLQRALTSAHSGDSVPAVPIELTFTVTDGSRRRARGRLMPRNVRRVGKGMLRIGGPVQWDDLPSRRAVIERCYIVEPYGARRGVLQRRAPRYPVDLRARVDGHPARLLDASDFGAAFQLPRHNFVPGVMVNAAVRLPSGRTVTGRFRPLHQSVERRGVRVGGEMEWRDTDWIEAHARPE